jgi:hypothetical protein
MVIRDTCYMDGKIKIKKKVFDVGEPKRTSVSLPERMYSALEQLANITNDSVPGVIVSLLEDCLIEVAKAGDIPFPEENSEKKIS